MQIFKKPLSPEKEKEYLAGYKEGDMEARNLLIEHNLRLVAHVAKKYQSPELDQEELISIGIIGLIKAVMTFDSEKNSRLATYAARCIENAILSQMRLYVPKKSPLVKSILVGGYLPNFHRILFLCAKLKMVS